MFGLNSNLYSVHTQSEDSISPEEDDDDEDEETSDPLSLNGVNDLITTTPEAINNKVHSIISSTVLEKANFILNEQRSVNGDIINQLNNNNTDECNEQENLVNTNNTNNNNIFSSSSGNGSSSSVSSSYMSSPVAGIRSADADLNVANYNSNSDDHDVKLMHADFFENNNNDDIKLIEFDQDCTDQIRFVCLCLDCWSLIKFK